MGLRCHEVKALNGEMRAIQGADMGFYSAVKFTMRGKEPLRIPVDPGIETRIHELQKKI